MTFADMNPESQSGSSVKARQRIRDLMEEIKLATSGTPASAVRASTLGLPLMLANIGGMPEQFTPFINLYKETAIAMGSDPDLLQIGINMKSIELFGTRVVPEVKKAINSLKNSFSNS